MDQVNCLLSLCNTCLTNFQYNNCIIEHLIVILCFTLRIKPEDSTKCFNKILATEYSCYAITFLLDLLEGAQYVTIKARIVTLHAKKTSFVEFSHKISTASMSSGAKELIVWEKEEFATEAELADPKVVSWQEYSRDRLMTGAVYLTGVKFTQNYLKKNRECC